MTKRLSKILRKRYPKPGAYRVMAEYENSGVWFIRALPPFRHGMVEWGTLGISDDLTQSFRQWIDYYGNRLFSEEEFDTTVFNQTGRSLAVRLLSELGEGYTVEFQGETEAGGLLETEQIGVSDMIVRDYRKK